MLSLVASLTNKIVSTDVAYAKQTGRSQIPLFLAISCRESKSYGVPVMIRISQQLGITAGPGTTQLIYNSDWGVYNIISGHCECPVGQCALSMTLSASASPLVGLVHIYFIF